MADSALVPPAIRDKQLSAALRVVRHVQLHAEAHGLAGGERVPLLHVRGP